MAICNRDLDVSEKNRQLTATVPVTAIGASSLIPLVYVEAPGVIRAFSLASYGVSGAVVGSLAINRFVTGAGLTAIIVAGASQALVNVGTSGPQSFTIPAASSTLVQVLNGDIISLVLVSGNNILQSQAALVVQSLADIQAPLSVTT